LLVVLAGPPLLRAENAAVSADFKEVYDLLRAKLSGATEAELNRAAVEGFVSALGPKVALVTNDAPSGASTNAGLLSKSISYDGNIGYLRVSGVSSGLAEAVRGACREMSATNKLKGLVLDLRYARGDDYAAAAETAGLFIKKQQPLLDWGKGMVESKEKPESIASPVAVLVNQETAGAAEALAAVLRETGAGLILGNKTAGQAMIAQEFPLKNGARLRIATAPVQLGDNTTLAGGIKPDITIAVNAADERAYYADAFKVIATTNLPGAGQATNQAAGTNSTPRRPRFNEAELVRERREGLNPDADVAPARNEEPDKPLVRDPALARALDLIKGLAVVRQARF
jgi:C-terminal processing protease CtpA/Prc